MGSEVLSLPAGFLVESFSSISHGSESLQKISESFHAFAGRRIWTLPAFYAYNEEYVDMIQAGILDPVKVTRSALQNATSVSATLLTTESVVSTIKEPAPAMPAGADGGMGMM